jgi:uncharacterized membrane protein YhaH (DUF805 family)
MFSNVFSLHGRIGMVEFFGTMVGALLLLVLGSQLLAFIIAQAVFGMIINFFDTPDTISQTMVPPGLALSAVLLLGSAWINLAGVVKRLHDIDHSGWYAMVVAGFWTIALCGLYLSDAALANIGIFLVFTSYVILTTSVGSQEDNRFGAALNK